MKIYIFIFINIKDECVNITDEDTLILNTQLNIMISYSKILTLRLHKNIVTSYS